MRPWTTPAALLLAAALPVLPILAVADAATGDLRSDLPVRIWLARTLPIGAVFGDEVGGAAFPVGAFVRNPDPVATLWFWATQGLLGDARAWTGLLVLQLLLSMLAVAALVRELVDDELAGWTGAVVAGLSPMVLAFGVTGAVSEALALWPYPLALRQLLRAARGERPAGDAALAGVFLGLGAWTCAEHALAFLSWVPLLAAAPALWREAADNDGVGFAWRRGLRIAAGLGLAAGLLVGLAALGRAGLPAEADALSPGRAEGVKVREAAVLLDYVAVGKRAAVVVDAGSRVRLAWSPGLVAMGLGLYGLLRGRARGASLLFGGVALFAALLATGPSLGVGAGLPAVPNPLWRFFAAPLELAPPRFVFPAVVALGVAAGLGAAALPGRLRAILPLIVVAELLVLTPAPYPPPAVRLEVPAAYERLSRLPPGAILDLPLTDRGGDRLDRLHFYWQLRHRRPIPDRVRAAVPGWLAENAFTASLLALEKNGGAFAVPAPAWAEVEAARRAFVDAGFSAIVVWPEGYVDPQRWRQLDHVLTEHFGESVYRAERVVWATRRRDGDGVE